MWVVDHDPTTIRVDTADTMLTAFDGTVFDLAATADITAQFATPSAGRFPQARLVTLVARGTRWVIAARLGCSGPSEQHLADQLLDALLPGTLNLADRNFFSMAQWVAGCDQSNAQRWTLP
ncbi:hypothetical protein ACFPIJ_52365 [Dactylosporangium cerinum]|uniref:Transposase n=1 Tax=Dactylosporangium cerinum TaxID=1434730 RepID=A0ABV9WD98_9ACTN